MAEIQWFPGHMAKTERELMESVKLADLVIEVLDARIPESSANPDFNKIFSGQRRLIALNKSDLADPIRSEKWKRHYRNNGCEAIFTNSKKGDGISRIRGLLQKAGDEKVAKQASLGVLNRPVRAIIAGIPNSGKSSLINMLSSKAAAKTGDKPGVTRRRQWIRLGDGIELLDTPGVLWPKFISEEIALHLAFTGAIRDEVYDTIDVAEKLLAVLCESYLPLVVSRYGDIATVKTPQAPANGDAGGSGGGGGANTNADAEANADAYPLLANTGKRRGFLARGGIVDYERTAAIVLDEFRAAKLGRITLEEP